MTRFIQATLAGAVTLFAAGCGNPSPFGQNPGDIAPEQVHSRLPFPLASEDKVVHAYTSGGRDSSDAFLIHTTPERVDILKAKGALREEQKEVTRSPKVRAWRASYPWVR